MGKRKFTVEDALEALGQNNIPFLSGALTSQSSRKIGGVYVNASACALGQCAINLGVNENELQAALGQFMVKDGRSLASTIIAYNDTYKHSPDRVAKLVREQLDPKLLTETVEASTMFSITVLKAS